MFDVLKKKYDQLLSPINQGLSQASRSIPQPVKSFVKPIVNEVRNVATQQIPSYQRAIPLTQMTSNPIGFMNAAKQQIQNFQQNKPLQAAKNVGMDVFNSAKLGANVYGGSKILAGGLASAAKTILPNAGIGGVFNKVSGGSFAEGAGQGVSMSPGIRGITGVTNPLIERYTQLLAPKLAPRLTNSAVGNYLTTSTLRGIQNVPEGAVIDASMGRRPLSPASIGMDFASGFIPGKPRVIADDFGGLIKQGKALGLDGINPKAFQLPQEDKQAAMAALDILRYDNKATATTEDRKYALQTIQNLLESVAPGYKTVNTRKALDAMEWIIQTNDQVPGELRTRLPKMGLVEGGEFKLPYKNGDITKLKQGLEDELSTVARTDPKKSRIEELEYYAKQGNEEAQAQLDLIRNMEDNVLKATNAKNSLSKVAKVKPQAQIQKEVRGVAQAGGGSGKPVKVKAYHGTDDNFDAFSKEHIGKNTDSGMFGSGFYFTDDLAEAKTYARKTGNVKEVELDFKKPYVINSEKDIPKIDVPNASLDDLKNGASNYSKAFTKYLQDRGYDGVIDNISPRKQYIAFEPTSIKSHVAQPPLYDTGTYYIRNGANELVKAENAKPINLGNNVEAFSHRFGKDTGVVISEAKTGMQIATGKTEKEAIANAQKAFKDLRGITPQQLIERQLKSLVRVGESDPKLTSVPSSEMSPDLLSRKIIPQKSGIIKETDGGIGRRIVGDLNTDKEAIPYKEVNRFGSRRIMQGANPSSVKGRLSQERAKIDQLSGDGALPLGGSNYPSSPLPQSSQPPVTDIGQKSFTQKGAMPEQQTGIAVRQPTELVPTTNSQKYVDFSKQEQQGLVPLEQSPLQQQRLSGGEQPPIRPPKQLAVGSGQIDPKQSSNTIIDSVRNKVNKIYTETLDRFHPLSSIANKAGEDTAMRRALTGHYGAGSTAQYHIDYELAPILKSTDVGELRKAAIAMRDAELKSRGIKGSNTDALSDLMSKQGKNGLKDPEMGIALKKLYKYQDDLVKKYLVGTEIMTQKAYSEMKSKNQFYIPFKRVMDDVDEWLGATPQKTGVGSVGSQNVIKKIKGSDRDIQDPLESIIENTYKIVGLAKRQEVAQTLASLETKLPKGTITKAFGKNLNPNNYFSVFEKGKAVHYKAPSDVIESAKGLNQDQISTIVKILAAPTRVFRATATGLNPEFMLPNVTRDLQSAFVNIGLNPLRFVSGLSHYMKRDQVYQDFLKSGGLTSQVSLDRPYLKKTVGEISSNKRGISVLKGGNLIDILAKVGQASEQPTRLAAFQKTLNDSLKKGIPRDQALQDAAYAAQESTINFGRRGSKTQSVNMIYAFMNARAQGTDRLIRSLKSNPKGAGLRMGMLTIAPAIGLYAYNRGFESYNDERIVPPYEKENNFIIMLSDTPIEALGGAQYVKIPKGDIGKLANPIEQFMSYADGKGGDVQSSLLSTLKAFSPATNIGDVVPTALRPAVENAANYNFFQKRAIVSESKQNYPAKFQFNKNTSGIYKEIGARLNVSPSKVENIVRGYLTGFARIGEMIAKPLEKEDKYSGQDINQTPVARRFLGGAVRTEDEQELNNYFEQKGVMNKVQDIKTGIKYGNIPVEDGLNEINKLLETNEKELQTKPQSNFGVKASNAASSADVMRQEIEDSQLKLRVEMSGKAEYNSQGDIVYVNENGNAATLKLNSPTKGTGIGAFANQNWNITKAREVYNNDQLSKEDKDFAFKKLGVKQEDVRYDALANYTNDIKSQYLISKSDTKEKLVNNILTGRKRSIGDSVFASDGVLDSMVDAGKLTKEEAKYLKTIDYNKDGTLKQSTAKGKKGRKPKLTKSKVIKISFPSSKKVKRVKSAKVTRVKQYRLKKVKKLTGGIKKVRRLS